MKSAWAVAALTCFSALLLSACGGNTASGNAAMSAARLPASAALLVRYDSDGNGLISRQELDEGLKKEFAAADPNNDSCIDREETRAENSRRLAQFGGQASPLTDWNLDGCVDATEFGNAARSYFQLADRTKDGLVSQQELRGPAMPIAPRATEQPVQQRAPEPERDEIYRNTQQF